MPPWVTWTTRTEAWLVYGDVEPAHVRVLIAEELTRSLIRRHADLIASADACWTPSARDWTAAHEALGDERWRTGDLPLIDEADTELGVWAYEVAASAIATGDPTDGGERAVLAHGLRVRLQAAQRARAIVDRVVAQGRTGPDAVVEIVASDPYLRALRPRGRLETRVRPAPGRSTLLAGLREWVSGSAAVRSLELGAPRRSSGGPRVRPNGVALFRPGRGYVDHFEPIERELAARGHDVVVFEYDHLLGDGDVVDFGAAVNGAGGRPARITARRWSLADEVLSAAPVHPAAVARAIDASWTVGAVQIDRHRRVLERWRPKVVLSFGPDTMSLALEAAALRCGIPSVYLPHGYLTPRPAVWSIPATATAVVGRACVEANALTPVGGRSDALVVIGHPQYDEFAGGRRGPAPARATIDPPPGRPRLVVVFTEWAFDLLDQAMQKRTLEMVGRALPRDAFLLCKLHPGREDRERSETTLGAVLPPSAFRIVSSRELSTSALLGICDAAVATEESMALIDAVLAGCPAIGIRHPENPPGTGPLRHPARRIEEVCTVVEDVEALSRALERTVRDPAACVPSADALAAYVRRSLFAVDGWSSVRAADLVEHLAAGEDPRTFVARQAPAAEVA